ncbi:hypothetical protein IQ250_05720 [Pseudanabaenaceae cyanobacterium LEGE 13415]|nr:hypothetical protein [Pseudanabaenaceae cyanobacterium LEGE 13415]
MSSIRISQLSAIGSDLFEDSESFLQELREYELKTVTGGLVISQVTVSLGYINPPDQIAVAFRTQDTQALQALRGLFKDWFDYLDYHAAHLSVWWQGLH